MDAPEAQATGPDVIDLSVVAVALLIYGIAHPLEVADVDPARLVVEHAVGTDLEAWVAGQSLDGEHVHFLVDTVRLREHRDPAFGAWLARLGAATEAAPRALRALGDACRRRRQWDAALLAYRAWEHLASAWNDASEEARCLTGISALYEDMGDYDAALSSLRRRRAIQVSRGEQSDAAATLIEVGSLHRELGRHYRALQCLERAASDLERAGDSGRAAHAYLGIAAVRRHQGMRGEAMHAIRRCREIVQLHPSRGISSAIWRELACLCEDDGRFELAGTLHALSSYERGAIGDRGGQADALRELARVRLLQNRSEDASAAYLESVALDCLASDDGRGPGIAPEDLDAVAAAESLVAAPDPCDRGRAARSRSMVAAFAAPLFRSRRAPGNAVA